MATISDETSTNNETKRSFVITGFGPFGGVEENPTTVVVRKIRSYIRSLNHEVNPELAEQIRESVIVETSAQAVDEAIYKIQNQHCDHLILLHLGVGRSEGFRLEQCAYNEASFRIPDQRGYRPNRKPIVSTDPVGHSYPTSLNLEILKKQMSREFPNISTVISNDPGRFVCNYVYCKSLEVTKIKTNCESLFLHVPHFEIIPEEEQLAYVAALIRNLAKDTV